MIVRWTLLLFILFVLPQGTIPGLLSAQPSELHIFVTGDLHGFLLADSTVHHGGIVSLGRTLRETTRSLPDSSFLIFDTGDALAYHYLSKVDSGRSVFKAMHDFNFAALVPGNLDFSYGHQHLQNLANAVPSPVWLAANLVDSLKRPIFPPWHIFRRHTLRVAVIGICDPQMRETVADGHLDGLLLLEPSAVLPGLLQEVRGRCDVLVVLSNLGAERNIRLAKSFPDIDLVLDHPQDEVPMELTKVRFDQGHQAVSIVPAPANALSVNHIVMQISRNEDGSLNKLVRVANEKSNSGSSEDEWRLQEQRLQAAYERQCLARYGRSADAPLAVCDGHTSAEGFIQYTLYMLLKSTHSEIALLNKGYFRQLERLSGPLTIRDIDRIGWSDDHVRIMRLRGKALKGLAGRSQRLSENSKRRLYYMAIQNYDWSAQRQAPWNVHGKPLQDEEEYAVVTSHFLGNGGDGYAEFSQKRYSKSRFIGYLRLLSDNAGSQVPINDLIIRYLCAGQPGSLTEWNAGLKNDDYINRPLWQLYIAGIDLSLQSVKVSHTQNYTGATEVRINQQAKQSRDHAMNLDLRLLRSGRNLVYLSSLWLKYNSTTIWPDHGRRLNSKESNLELAQTIDMRKARRFSPYLGLRLDSDMELVQRDLVPSLGLKWGQEDNMIRLAGIGKWDGRTHRKSGGVEMNGLYHLGSSPVQMDGRIRMRYLFGNSTLALVEERWTVEWRHGFKIPLSEHLALKPQFEWFLFKGRRQPDIARNWQVAFQLSYSRIWKFQYQKFYRREER